MLWRYDELRPLLMEAGRLLTAEEAERRVLILENPGLAGRSQITDSLYAGLQLILPGEIAECHRHVASALRFILEGHGRVHLGQRGTHGDEPWRSHPDAVVDVSRAWESWCRSRSSGSTAWTCRS